MRRSASTASGTSWVHTTSFAAAIGLLACCLLVGTSSIACADDDETPAAAPRTAVIIGDASVVLVATKDKLYAFVDRLDDNAPVKDAELSIMTDEGNTIDMTKAPITMTRATDGLFVGSFNRAGHMQDAFMVSLQSSAGSGDAPAEIIYHDVRVSPAALAAAAAAQTNLMSKLAVAGVSAGIGIIVTVFAMVWWRGRSRRASARSVGTAQAA